MNTTNALRPRLSSDRWLLSPLMLQSPQIVYAAIDASRAELSRWMAWCPPSYSLADSQQYFATLPGAWERGEEFPLAICDAVSGEFLGSTGINFIDRLNRRANLGYWVRTDRTGRGIATDVVRLLAPAALADLSLERIEIVAAAENAASRAVALKAGATLEGIARRRLRTPQGQCDAACYSLLRTDVGLPPLDDEPSQR